MAVNGSEKQIPIIFSDLWDRAKVRLAIIRESCYSSYKMLGKHCNPRHDEGN